MVSEMESVNKSSANAVVNESSYLENTNSQPVHSPQSVGTEFVRQYYTILNRAPQLLHRFYSDDSTFTHGCLDRRGEPVQYLRGHKQINQKIMAMNYKNCRTKIRQVDSMETVGNAIVIQVTGDLSNNSQPLRRFLQTFVLTPQSPNKYYVRNDIFRYQDEICIDENEEPIDKTDTETKLEQSTAIESMQNTNNDLVLPEKEYGVYPANGDDNETPNVAEENVPNEEEENSVREDVTSEANVEIPEMNEAKNRFEEEADDAGSVSDSNANQLSNEPKTYANMVSKSFQGGSVVVAAAATTGQPSSNRPPVPERVNGNPTPEAAAVTVAEVANPSAIVSAPAVVPPNPATAAVVSKSPAFVQRENQRGFSKKASFANRRNESKDNGRNNDSDSADGESHFNSGPKKYPDEHQLFIGNLMPNFTEDELHNIFQKYGKIVEVRINRQMHKMGSNNNKTSRNYGFITFENPEVVDQIIAQKPIFHDNHRYNVEKKQGKSSSNFERNRNNANGNIPRNSNLSNVAGGGGGPRHPQSNTSGGGQGGSGGGGNMSGQRNRSGGPNYNHSSNNSNMNSRNFGGGGGGQNYQNRTQFGYQQNR